MTVELGQLTGGCWNVCPKMDGFTYKMVGFTIQWLSEYMVS